MGVGVHQARQQQPVLPLHYRIDSEACGGSPQGGDLRALHIYVRLPDAHIRQQSADAPEQDAHYFRASSSAPTRSVSSQRTWRSVRPMWP